MPRLGICDYFKYTEQESMELVRQHIEGLFELKKP